MVKWFIKHGVLADHHNLASIGQMSFQSRFLLYLFPGDERTTGSVPESDKLLHSHTAVEQSQIHTNWTMALECDGKC